MHTWSRTYSSQSPFSGLREFFADLPSLHTPERLADAVSAAAAPLGLPSVMCGAVIVHGGKAGGRFYFSNWTSNCREAYSEAVFVRDPIIHEARRRITPFTWQDLKDDENYGGVWTEVDALTRPLGWHDRLAVPIHGPGGYVGMLQFAGPIPIELTETTQAIVQSLAYAAHHRGRELYKPGVPVSVPRLTVRERQVMRWIANGKTDAEIGEIFSISATTVHSYAEQAKRKLGARSRPQAVSEMALFELL